jgi:hypothetical protein
MSAFLKNWPVKVLGGRCLSYWGPLPSLPLYICFPNNPIPSPPVTQCINTLLIHTGKGGGMLTSEKVNGALFTWILVGWLLMAPLGPLKECRCSSGLVILIVLLLFQCWHRDGHHVPPMDFVGLLKSLGSPWLPLPAWDIIPDSGHPLGGRKSFSLCPAWLLGSEYSLDPFSCLREFSAILNHCSLFIPPTPFTILYTCTMSSWCRLSFMAVRPSSFRLSL